MSVEVQWTTRSPGTSEKRYVRVDRFAGLWRFRERLHRRDDWAVVSPTREDWTDLLDGLERRYTRREGVSEADLAAVRKILAGFRSPPELDVEILGG